MAASGGLRGDAGSPVTSGAGGAKGPMVKVTVRRGDIFRRFSQFHFVKMNPYVEVLMGETHVGTVPAATGADLQPVWNHQLPTQEFEIGQELHLRVMDRNNWPRKDVHVGSGSVKLAAELIGGPERRSVEQTVQLQKKHQGEKPEVTGSVNVSLTFLGQQAAPLPPPYASPAESPRVAPLPLAGASPTPSVTSNPVRGGIGPAVAAAPPAEPHSRPAAEGHNNAVTRVLHFEDQGKGHPPDDASVVSSNRPTALASAVMDPEAAEKQRHLVSQQYYDREVRAQSWRPVLCTDGVYRLWQRWRCSRNACSTYACAGGTVAATCAISWVVQLIC